MAARVSLALACLSLILCITGTVTVARAFVANAGHLTPVFAWSILPLSIAVVALVSVTRRGAPWVVWTMAGSLWGFVVAAMWSLGTFYARGAIALLLAAIVDLFARKARRHVLFAVLWLVAGFTALGPFFLVADWLRAMSAGVTVSHAEAIVWASWAFAGTLAVLAVALTIEARRVRVFRSGSLR